MTSDVYKTAILFSAIVVDESLESPAVTIFTRKRLKIRLKIVAVSPDSTSTVPKQSFQVQKLLHDCELKGALLHRCGPGGQEDGHLPGLLICVDRWV
jgi:hypothetical protein